MGCAEPVKYSWAESAMLVLIEHLVPAMSRAKMVDRMLAYRDEFRHQKPNAHLARTMRDLQDGLHFGRWP